MVTIAKANLLVGDAGLGLGNRCATGSSRAAEAPGQLGHQACCTLDSRHGDWSKLTRNKSNHHADFPIHEPSLTKIVWSGLQFGRVSNLSARHFRFIYNRKYDGQS